MKGAEADTLEAATIDALQQVPEQVMLTDGIKEAYDRGVGTFTELMEEVAQCGQASGARAALPALFKVSAEEWMQTPALQEEVFGAAGILVLCEDTAEMAALAESLEGQLTCTFQPTFPK